MRMRSASYLSSNSQRSFLACTQSSRTSSRLVAKKSKISCKGEEIAWIEKQKKIKKREKTRFIDTAQKTERRGCEKMVSTLLKKSFFFYIACHGSKKFYFSRNVRFGGCYPLGSSRSSGCQARSVASLCNLCGDNFGSHSQAASYGSCCHPCDNRFCFNEYAQLCRCFFRI